MGEEDKRRRDKERKNPLTADLSISKDWGKDTALYFFKHGTENQVVQRGVRESGEKRGVERQEEQEVDGKVIAVSTWSIA